MQAQHTGNCIYDEYLYAKRQCRVCLSICTRYHFNGGARVGDYAYIVYTAQATVNNKKVYVKFEHRVHSFGTCALPAGARHHYSPTAV